jgi:hypothetical protein
MPVAFYAAWLPRSFTLNALVKITAALPSDIRAFGDYLSSPSEKTIHLIGAPQDVLPKMFFCFYREHVREITP